MPVDPRLPIVCTDITGNYTVKNNDIIVGKCVTLMQVGRQFGYMTLENASDHPKEDASRRGMLKKAIDKLKYDVDD